jgi:exopolyphosphatase/guanosine-5'-triphosphate,3'-diphosphate pyrophosphatase
MRIAAIDIGTNSIHMVIARATPAAGLEVLDREREVVQVGKNSFSGGRLAPEAIERTVDSLARFVRLAHSHRVHHIVCTTTAAVREAENGGEFLAIATQVAGVTPRVIPTEIEGRLIYLAVKHAIELDSQPSVIIDIGGGSVQLVVGNHERCLQVISLPLGALRLQETIIDKDPLPSRDLNRLRDHIRLHADQAIKTILAYRPVRVLGSSGSIHALAEISSWLETGSRIEHINGYLLTTASLERLTRRLRRLPLAERQKLRGLESKRAEIITPAAVLLTHLLKELKADGITLSDFSLREGLVIDYVEHHPDEMNAHEVSDLRLRSVLQLLTRMHHQQQHPAHIARLALELFDGLMGLHGLSADARSLLHCAALLHDIGSVIGYDKHAQHSYYIIKNGNLRGFDGEEIDIIANVARYHGKARPRKRERSFGELGRASRNTVRWLAALLRIAEGLDRSHYQLIRSVRVVPGENELRILASARPGAQLEIWAGQQRTDLLHKMLGVPVHLETEEEPRVREAPSLPATRVADSQSEPGRPGSSPSSPAPSVQPEPGVSRPAGADPFAPDARDGGPGENEAWPDHESRPAAPGSPAEDQSE